MGIVLDVDRLNLHSAVREEATETNTPVESAKNDIHKRHKGQQVNRRVTVMGVFGVLELGPRLHHHPYETQTCGEVYEYGGHHGQHLQHVRPEREGPPATNDAQLQDVQEDAEDQQGTKASKERWNAWVRRAFLLEADGRIDTGTGKANDQDESH